MIIEYTTVTCGSEPQVTKNPDGTFDVKLNDPEWTDLLFGFELDEIISHFDEDKILEHIGESAVIDKFNLHTDYEFGVVEEELEKIKREQDEHQKMSEAKERIADQKAYINFEDKPKNQ